MVRLEPSRYTSVLTGSSGISEFRTDTDISSNTVVRERTLQKWEPAADTNANLSLESSTQSAGWDQFATNERLFGVRSDYDENIYTTTIDRSHPQYAERAALAEKKAREIEGSSALNAHVREERAQNATGGDKDVDEEDLYAPWAIIYIMC
jgi:PAB1-binding protein PBP1